MSQILVPALILFARCRDVDTEDALGEVLSEISNSSSAKPQQSTEAPSRKRKVAASLSKVLLTKCASESLITPRFRVLLTLPIFSALASAYLHFGTQKKPSDPQQQLLQRAPSSPPLMSTEEAVRSAGNGRSQPTQNLL
jgi:hypothetical protein